MKTTKPLSIRRRGQFLLEVEWSDGFNSVIKLESLRNTCPCAECKGDELNSKAPSFQMLTTFKQGMNELKALKPVGNYAITAVWGDGHDTGIYTYDYLRQIFRENQITDEEIAKYDLKNNGNND